MDSVAIEAMEADELDAFLRERGSGILALSAGGETYAVPEAFGYDGENLYFQFVTAADSRKMSFVETTDVATFTTYTDEEPARSVIVRGALEPVPEDDAEAAAAAIFENGSLPALDLVGKRSADASVALYRLRPQERSGRTFGATTGVDAETVASLD